MTEVSRSFTKRLRDVAAPALASAGFGFDGKRTFRRFPDGSPCVQIVNFQLGERAAQGTFCVNLAIYDPARCSARVDVKDAEEYHCSADLRERLAFLVPGSLPALERLPLLGWAFRPKDRWWPASNDDAVAKARDLVLRHGLAWLERHTASPRP